MASSASKKVKLKTSKNIKAHDIGTHAIAVYVKMLRYVRVNRHYVGGVILAYNSNFVINIFVLISIFKGKGTQNLDWFDVNSKK